MAVQLNVTTRNARLDAIEVTNGASCSLRIYSGAQPANCAAANTGTLLAHIVLPADWLAAASSGSKAIAGSWVDASADGTGTAAHFRVYNSQVTMDGTTCFLQGSAGLAAADMILDSVSFTAGQQFTVSTFTMTDANP
jgi:hypothetical protein